MNYFNQKNYVFLLLLALAFTLNSCKKDLLSDPASNSNLNHDAPQAMLGNQIQSGAGITILGDKRNNPYAIDNIKLALETIHGGTFNPAPTHLYLRMRPTAQSHVLIMDSLDLDWEDQPIDYEVVYQGEYYKDPNLSEEEAGWSYATVPADFSFPDVPYEILEEMVIPQYHSHLTFKAFQLSGNEEVYEGLLKNGCTPECLNYPACLEDDMPCLQSGGDNPSDCTTDCPNYPCCFLEGFGCDDQLCNDYDCYPGAPDWPACNGPSDNMTTDACGCSVITSINKPTGRVTVEDTVLDPDASDTGVRFVKVKAKPNRWFSFIWRSDYTDNNGCFKINHGFTTNSIKLKVKFKNPYCILKAWEKGATFFAYQSKTQIIEGPDFSNLCIPFLRGGLGTVQTRDWQAATVANTVAEFHDWELGLPDQPLIIWIDRSNFGAPMFGLANNIAWCVDEIVLGSGNLLDYYEMVRQQTANVLGVGLHLISWYLPDVVLADVTSSPRFKRIIFHELAHVNHYTIAGECYWRKVRAHEYYMSQATPDGDPYGDPNVALFPPAEYTNFSIVALTESWGDHVGYLYAHRIYGDEINPTNLLRVERSILDNNFIPVGLHYDLMDGINNSEPNGINDSVSGATLLELYYLLDNETVESYKADVITSTSATGNIDNLFSQYGY